MEVAISKNDRSFRFLLCKHNILIKYRILANTSTCQRVVSEGALGRPLDASQSPLNFVAKRPPTGFLGPPFLLAWDLYRS